MKRTRIQLWLTVVMVFATTVLAAQTRYLDEVFTDVQVMNDVKYAENYSIFTGSPNLTDLEMDVYMPVGDTVGNAFYEEKRPLIILGHAGSFLQKDVLLPFGAKNDSCLIEMCTQFAKRGWVAVSINYRRGWNPLSGDEDVRKGTIINAVYRAMQDMKACVRFFREDADTDDEYRVDPYRVAVGGTNSGGYAALAAATLNNTSEANLLKFRHSVTGEPYIDQSITGGFYGEGGTEGFNTLNNTGYSSEAQVVLNMGGAIGDTTWQEVGEAPIVNFHGIADPLTPYQTAIVIVSATGDPVVEVSGGFDIAQRATNLGNTQLFIDLNLTDPYTQAAESISPYEGLFGFGGGLANGYEPWAWYDSSLNTVVPANAPQISPAFPPPYSGFGSDANPYATRQKAEAYIDTIMEYFAPRALEAFNNIDSAAVETADPATPPTPVGIEEAYAETYIDVYPNPVSSTLLIQTYDMENPINLVEITDLTGKVMVREDVGGDNIFQYNRNGLSSGVYLLNIELTDGRWITRKVLFN